MSEDRPPYTATPDPLAAPPPTTGVDDLPELPEDWQQRVAEERARNGAELDSIARVTWNAIRSLQLDGDHVEWDLTLPVHRDSFLDGMALVTTGLVGRASALHAMWCLRQSYDSERRVAASALRRLAGLSYQEQTRKRLAYAIPVVMTRYQGREREIADLLGGAP